MNASELCDELERIYDGGDYPALTVGRPWSSHNPTLVGELARPSALRWYLVRELERLAEAGADLSVSPSRPRIALDDPAIGFLAIARLDDLVPGLLQGEANHLADMPVVVCHQDAAHRGTLSAPANFSAAAAPSSRPPLRRLPEGQSPPAAGGLASLAVGPSLRDTMA
mgnify:CR=1 FL=1